MLIAHIGSSKAGEDKLLISGDLGSCIAEVCVLISTIKARVAVANPQAGEEFEGYIRALAADPRSPMWTTVIRGEGYSIVKPKREE